MNRLHRLFLWVLMIAACSAPAGVAQAGMIASGCESFREDAAYGSIPTAQLIDDPTSAVECLMRIIDEVSQRKVPIEVDSEAQQFLLQSTGALLRIFEYGDIALQTEAVEQVQDLMTLQIADLLSYGARSKIRQLRLNSAVTLANVVDNKILCVPLDHLADPAITEDGRVNLLGIVSQVAPWAVAESYRNLETVALYFQSRSKQRADMRETAETAANILSRLRAQDKAGSGAARLQKNSSQISACREYTPKWATGAPAYSLDYAVRE